MRYALLLLFVSFPVLAQLSPEQKAQDFQQLVSLFAKRYAFFEWKKQAVKFDGLDLKPWLERIAQTKDDLAYFELCAEYVASYQDGHTAFYLPSDFTASLGFSADIYSGKVLIDEIDREKLPASLFPFDVGDELVSIDGKPAMDLINSWSKMVGDGNPRTSKRFAASFLTNRDQSLLPRAHEIGEKSIVLVQRRGGAVETYEIAWTKSGIPYTQAGPVPTPKLAAEPVRRPGLLDKMRRVEHRTSLMTGFGVRKPVYDLPAGFVRRFGEGRFDRMYTGTFDAGGYKIGYIRIPSFSSFPSSRDLNNEINFMEANTDGMILDVSRNPGGSTCSLESLASRFAANPMTSLQMRYRVTWDYLQSLRSELDFAIYFGDPPEDIDAIQKMVTDAERAYKENRGMSDLTPMCSYSPKLTAPIADTGRPVVYSKPVLLLIDDLSFSAAEAFAALMQDNQRATLFGYRTDGAGGAVDYRDVGIYSETGTSFAFTILERLQNIATGDFPLAPYIENLGVRPDKELDPMTEDNLLQRGKPFVDAFTSAVVDLIRAKKGS